MTTRGFVPSVGAIDSGQLLGVVFLDTNPYVSSIDKNNQLGKLIFSILADVQN